MTYDEIVNVILTHKSLSKCDLKISETSIIEYRLDDSVYKIFLLDYLSKVRLLYEVNIHNGQGINFNISKRCKNPETVVRNFKKMLKGIDKVRYFINKLEYDTDKFTPRIQSYIKNNYDIDINLENNQPSNNLSVNFCDSILKYRKKNITIGFNFLIEKYANYNIYVTVKDINFDMSLQLMYYSNNDELILVSKCDTYKNLSNDITKIIRCERLKKINNFHDND